MKKVFVILLIFQSINSFSQKFGVKLGANLSYSSLQISVPNFGVNYEFSIAKKVSFNTELNFIQRAYAVNVLYMDSNTGSSLINGNERVNQSFVQLPLQVKFYLGKEAEKHQGLSVNVGAYLAYDIKKGIVYRDNLNYSLLTGSSKEQLQDSFDGNVLGNSKLDYGVNVGASYSLSKIPLFFDLRIYKGFSDQELSNLYGLYFYKTPLIKYPFGESISPAYKSLQGVEISIGYNF
jgi:hypothetical protein